MKSLSKMHKQISFHDPSNALIVSRLSHTTQMSPSYRMSLFVDMSCAGSYTLMEALPEQLFGRSYTWLLLWTEDRTNISKSPLTAGSELLLKHLRRDTNMILAIQSHNHTFTIMQVYRESITEIHVTELGNGADLAAVDDRVAKSLQRRNNFNGRSIRVVVQRIDRTYFSSSLTEATGFHPHDANSAIFLNMVQILNFSIQLVINDPDEVNFDDRVAQRDVDIGVTFLATPTLAGRTDVSIIHPNLNMVPMIFFLQPSVSSLRNAFLEPFETSAWLCFVGVTVLVSIMLMTSMILNEHRLHRQLPWWDASEITLLVLAVVAQQSAYRMPHSDSGRIAFMSLLLPVIIIYSIYSGQVVSLLSSRNAPISSIDDLAQYNFQMGTSPRPVIRSYFADINVKSVQKLGATRKVVSLFEGMTAMKTGRNCYASGHWILNAETSKRFSQTQLCAFDHIELPYSKVPLSFTVPPNSQYKEIFNWASLRLIESGTPKYLWLKNKKVIQCSKENFVSLEISGLTPAFILLGGGLISSVIICLAEIVLHARRTLYTYCTRSIHIQN